ncbi:MAG: pilus assembly protein TadG-related protein [Planctomycetes bacterium]|nr:pilus assembly protein TadG-related protein [Planctomycetota bacterium]
MNFFLRKRKSPGRQPRRRGLMIVLMGAFIVVDFGLCALTIDLGYLYLGRTELQRTADATALAAAAVLMDQHDLNGTPCPSSVAYAARSTGELYSRLNPCLSEPVVLGVNSGNAADGDFVLGHYNSTTGVFDPSSTRYNSVYSRVRRDTTLNGPLPLFFANIWGRSSANVSCDAAAYIETDVRGFQVETEDNHPCKLLPFSLQIDLWQARVSQCIDDYTHNTTSQTVCYGPDGAYEVDLFPIDLGPGNFGTIDIGSANNSSSDLSRQILYGPDASDFAYYPNNTLQFDENGVLIMNGDTGISAAIKDELNAITGQPRILPLHAMVWGNGNNASFQIVAFVGVTIVDARLNGALSKKYVKIQPCFTVDDTAIAGGQDGTSSRFILTPPRLRRTQ